MSFNRLTFAFLWILTVTLHLFDAVAVGTNTDNAELALTYIKHKSSTIANHPYLVSLSYKDVFQCSGVVLTKRWVLTTSSCIWAHLEFQKKSIRIRAKSHSVSSGGIVYNVTKVITHPKFMFYSTEYNVALLKTHRPMSYSKKLRPIALAKRNMLVNETAVASGWGLLKTKDTSKSLTAVDVRVQIVQPCRQGYLEYSKLILCGRPAEEGPCWDDEANPIVNNGELYGLSSFVISCTGEKYPARFANVPDLRQWIKNEMQGISSQ